MTAPAITAVRTWNRPRTAAIVTIRFGDEAITAGGRRAARAAAVIMTFRPDYRTGEAAWKLYGLRADLHAAEVEATRLRTATTTRAGRKHLAMPITPALNAIAVPVTDATVSEAPASAPAGGNPVIATQEESTLMARKTAAPAATTTTTTTTRPSKPASERSNEATHEVGAAVVAATGCPSCKARKGALCFARSGERTNHIHAARMRKGGQ